MAEPTCATCLDTGRVMPDIANTASPGYCPRNCAAAMQARGLDAQLSAMTGSTPVLIPQEPEKPRREPMTHVLETAPAMWLAVRDGVKTAEFRRDDRGFEVGDTLDLRFITEGGASLRRRVTHVVRGPIFGIPEGFAMLSLASEAAS